MMYLFSLIIPVYNVEKYLESCIRSVIWQKPADNNLEVILVDDGSEDSSGKICDRYADAYDYIRVIHKENGGLSSARNSGLSMAEGHYVLFMDSDDWWNPDVDFSRIADYVKSHEQCEMFLFNGYDYNDSCGYYKRNDHDHLGELDTSDIKRYYKSLLDNGNLEVSACTKVLSRDFLISNKLFFRTGLLSEDNEWMIRLLRVLRHVEVIDEPLYICRLNREGSITNSIRQKNVADLLKIVRSSQKYYEMYPKHELKELELCFASYLWFSALGLSTLLDQREKRVLKKYFYKTSGACAYSNSPKTRTCYVIYKIAGMSVTSMILGMYIRLKGIKPVTRTSIPDISKVSELDFASEEKICRL